ncbi:BlaI/MecI/CopY family transcriptional regulator [Halorubrum sp. AD140]|uniref:BlaI/MecI/CopY family transcriptional regulator n=1 Tax=Halorubrum sp. AD140 TaxID=3050073 RepID=UPI002ACCEEDD|nr:BlaI/MecI/CopY family transcriptional regulator [Halorubrum sp. AD140]MDZ5812573.1 BlaI/MecI/CopY family transcriptional regulator [Halorubrum sp. AD140]
MTQWTQLGPRERELLAVLRRADGGLTTRDLLDAVVSRGDDVAYTTVKRTADRLVEKDLVERETERYRGTPRHRYRFDADAARDRLVPEFVDELRTVLGDPAVERIARTVRTDDDGADGGADATTRQ